MPRTPAISVIKNLIRKSFGSPGLLFCLLIGWLCSSCLADKHYRYPKSTENQKLVVDEGKADVLMKKFSALQATEIPSLQQRLDRFRERGIFAPVILNLVGEAASAVRTLIINEQNKYTTTSYFAREDINFYDQPSLAGPFDPAGMQFTGFDIVRTIDNGGSRGDTALFARFEIDTTRSAEILSNASFRLKLTAFQLKYVKPKVSITSKKKMSLDFDITFLTSYVTQNEEIVDSLVLGRFHLLIKDLSIDLGSDDFGILPKGSPEPLAEGKSFVVPRSFGYFKTDKGIVSGYSRGQYSIMVTVRESTRPGFANALLTENGNLFINSASQKISQKLSN